MNFPLLSETAPPVKADGDSQAVSATWRASYSGLNLELEGVKTLYELFTKSAEQFADLPCLGCRPIANGIAQPFDFCTYKAVQDQVAELASGLATLGLGKKDKLGILASNCVEWMLCMQATNRMNWCCVPLYETLGDNAIEFIVSHAECKVVAAHASKLPALLKVADKIRNTVVGGIVYWGTPSGNAQEGLKAKGIPVYTIDEISAAGKARPVAAVPPAESDVCTIMYTSGTTGDPKGVQLTHKAVVNTIASAKAYFENNNAYITTKDVFLSYLPLAHIFDRVCEEFLLLSGASIGYWQGDIKKLTDDLEALAPTLLIGVPRVFDRIHSTVKEKISKAGLIAKLIFNYFMRRKGYFMERGYNHQDACPWGDYLVFNTLKSRLGGRVRVILSGGAPLSPAVEHFLRVGMCASVVQGYGLTEACAASFISQLEQFNQCGTVGPPMPGMELRLEAVPEMGYEPTGAVPRGEICLRGASLFSGYYKNPEMTKEVMDADGFFHTGDIGEVVGDGVLRVIDRKKNIFKLAQGEYVAVERLENVYALCPVVEQVWVYGSSFEAVLVAVVVPRESVVQTWAQQHGFTGMNMEELCNLPAMKQWVLGELVVTGKAARLKGFELVKGVILTPQHFTTDNDLMTPKFSLKRPSLLKVYGEQIKKLYASLAE